MGPIEFRPRWREELEAISQAGKLVFELTMGRYHVYFPDQARWSALAPPWALDHWQTYHNACQAWCRQNRIPMTLTPDAHFYEEK
jgi:hypothetical protein